MEIWKREGGRGNKRKRETGDRKKKGIGSQRKGNGEGALFTVGKGKEKRKDDIVGGKEWGPLGPEAGEHAVSALHCVA